MTFVNNLYEIIIVYNYYILTYFTLFPFDKLYCKNQSYLLDPEGHSLSTRW